MSGVTSSNLKWNPLGATYILQGPLGSKQDDLANQCPFCEEVSSGQIEGDVHAWVRRSDSPAFIPPVGECYDLIYSRDHNRMFADLDQPDAMRVMQLWQQVYQDLAPLYDCVMTWETFGAAAGQTNPHPHGHAYGVSFVPPTLQQELDAIAKAEASGRQCLFCEELQLESHGPQAVTEGKHWLGFVPAYARYPYQVHFIARQHVSHIASIAEQDALEELAVSLARVQRAYNQIFEAPMPYMLVLHQLSDPRFHVHVELLPVGRSPMKVKLAASGEIGFGLWVNESSPEAKAAELRAHLGP